MKTKKTLIAWPLMIVCLLVTLMPALSAKANQFNFSVKPTLPANQLAKDSSYFHLLMKENEKQTLELTLKNSTDKLVTVEASVAGATTNSNGVVEYSLNNIKPAKSLKVNMADLVEMPKEIALDPQSTKKISVTLTMPAEHIDGVVAGGLTFKQKSSETDTDSGKKSGMAIKNEFSYVIALLAQETENVDIKPDLVLNDFGTTQVNYRNSFFAAFEEVTPVYLNQLKIDAKVTNQKDANIAYEISKDNLQMAPNTTFEFPIGLGEGKSFIPGTYEAKITAYGVKDDNGQYVSGKDTDGKEAHYRYKWTFTKTFTVSGKEASKWNDRDVTIVKTDYTIYFIIGGAVLVFALILILFLLARKRRKNKDDDDNVKGNDKEDVKDDVTDNDKEDVKDDVTDNVKEEVTENDGNTDTDSIAPVRKKGRHVRGK